MTKSKKLAQNPALNKPVVKSRFVWVVWKRIFSTDVPRMVAIFGGSKENKAWHYMMQEQQKDRAYNYWKEKQTCF